MDDYLTEEDKPKGAKFEPVVKTVTEVVVESDEKEEETKTEEPKEEVKETKEVKEEVKEEPKKEDEDLSSKTLVELKEIAKERGIKGYSALKKDDLIDLLK